MFSCTLQRVGGPSLGASVQAFLQSYNETARAQHYQQYQSLLQQYFQNAMDKNIRQANIDAQAKSFSMKIESNQIQFISDNQSSIKYEYGFEGVPPKRFIQPAVIETANMISNLIISDAISIYNRNIGLGTVFNNEQTFDITSNYFNKYSSLSL